MISPHDRDKQKLIDQWTELLMVEFGGLDWWRLPRKWKRVKARRVAKMIAREIGD